MDNLKEDNMWKRLPFMSVPVTREHTFPFPTFPAAGPA